ncbi:hypothetical protein PGIGA_G00168470, partial [Pangasianodon gigas]|nr:hypothetical protein [Pangasianodon gigas]
CFCWCVASWSCKCRLDDGYDQLLETGVQQQLMCCKLASSCSLIRSWRDLESNASANEMQDIQWTTRRLCILSGFWITRATHHVSRRRRVGTFFKLC